MNLKEYMLAKKEIDLMMKKLMNKPNANGLIDAWQSLDEFMERLLARADIEIRELHDSNSCLLKNNYHQQNIINQLRDGNRNNR